MPTHAVSPLLALVASVDHPTQSVREDLHRPDGQKSAEQLDISRITCVTFVRAQITHQSPLSLQFFPFGDHGTYALPSLQSEEFRFGRMFDLLSRRTRQNLAIPHPTPCAQFSYGLVRQIPRFSWRGKVLKPQ